MRSRAMPNTPCAAVSFSASALKASYDSLPAMRDRSMAAVARRSDAFCPCTVTKPDLAISSSVGTARRSPDR